jgi:hypothetical protein
VAKAISAPFLRCASAVFVEWPALYAGVDGARIMRHAPGRWKARWLWGAASAAAMVLPATATPKLSGERQVWRTVTLDFKGPRSAETATPNPFTDYRLDVEFSNGSRRYRVPGYFAACGKAALTSCESGDVWRVHFTPDVSGDWRYKIVFRRGANIILGGAGDSIGTLDGESGTIAIAPTVPGSVDPRDRGRLLYTGQRYLRYSATGEVFFKAGTDAPENALAYGDFDATPNRQNMRKRWAPHANDGAGVDIVKYGWNGKGRNLLGAVAYLADQGMNAFSFLTFSLGGDDQNVFPHRMKVSIAEYNELGPRQQWDEGVEHLRFDVSKLDQWGRVFSYANDRGMFLHFKLQELENDDFMDGGDTGIERVAYLRQMIARYGHFLALNWNAGEENTQTAPQEIAAMAKIAELDPYQHLRVSHSYPGRKVRYFPLLGERSAVTGISMQGEFADFSDVRPEIAEWALRSSAAGRPWVIASDEQGGGDAGIPIDADYPIGKLTGPRKFDDDRRAVRGQVLWATLTGGGYGVEYYYGYASGCSDLLCEDHRTRATKWHDAKIALDFFRKHVGNDVLAMEPLNTQSGTRQPFWFGEPGEKMIVYAHDGKSIRERAMVDNATYRISWFDPTTGGMVKSIEKATEARSEHQTNRDLLVTGPAPGDGGKDWVLLIERVKER